MVTNYMPDGSPTVTPYLAVKGVAALIDFLKLVFDAKELDRLTLPDGRIMNAAVSIGNSRVMMGDPGDRPSEPAMLYVYVPDCDAVYAEAIAAGATSLVEPVDMFYGDRTAAFQDASGNKWWVATHKEDVPHDELARRAAAARRG
jgi:PhnB protein